MRRRLVLGLIFIGLLVLENHSFSQNARQLPQPTIAGNWKLNFQPYSGPEFEKMPLQVISVVAVCHPPQNGILVRERRLRNRAEKRVIRASFDAFIYREEDPEKLLFRHYLGTEGFSKVPAVFPGTEWPAPCHEANPYYCPYEFGMSPQVLLAPLMKDGTLEGDYRIAIGVTKVWFEDGSIWEIPVTSEAQKKTP